MAGIIHKDDIRHPAHPQYAGIKKEVTPAVAEQTSAEKEQAENAGKIPARKSETK